ncbi:hypothetical protein [Myxococcus xanthus]|uniref:Uncharacterized protein n=2 Tax=Myxococcus xanthus TaxID=34 RepID=A0A7Y4IJM8_MYXXA|nr:hypothetical protein [Myxococcus xanthus]NOJ80498.1 hypothetical protein [Myxococcus xanthus]
MAPRKTAKQQQEEKFNAGWRAQVEFEQEVRRLKSRKEAADFVESGPRQGQPGGQLYTNFGAFLNDLDPSSASDWERQLYIEFRERTTAAKRKKQGSESAEQTDG